MNLKKVNFIKILLFKLMNFLKHKDKTAFNNVSKNDLEMQENIWLSDDINPSCSHISY